MKLTSALALALTALGLFVPTAVATPDGYQPQLQSQQRSNGPDGYQPQLRASADNGAATHPDSRATRVIRFPSAAEFADAFVGTSNAFAVAHGDPSRIREPHCVQAAPGRYMCSYVISRPGAPRECHLMQARWTPWRLSTITITLAGRTARCGSLREALQSLV